MPENALVGAPHQVGPPFDRLRMNGITDWAQLVL